METEIFHLQYATQINKPRGYDSSINLLYLRPNPGYRPKKGLEKILTYENSDTKSFYLPGIGITLIGPVSSAVVVLGGVGWFALDDVDWLVVDGGGDDDEDGCVDAVVTKDGGEEAVWDIEVVSSGAGARVVCAWGVVLSSVIGTMAGSSAAVIVCVGDSEELGDGDGVSG